MKVFGIRLCIQLGTEVTPITSPYPTSSGIIVHLIGGDVVQPLGGGDWFKPPYFNRVFRSYTRIPFMPFISVRLGRFGFYAGSKVFGVDSPAYLVWMVPKEEVYEGSLAMMACSIRGSRSIGVPKAQA